MVTLNIYRGLPGSGKSTLAAERAGVDSGRLVGRDRIRALLGVRGIGTRAQENEVTALQGRLITEGLRAGQNVHVDDMNLKSAYVARLMGIAECCGAEVAVHDLTNVDPWLCVKRNEARVSGQVSYESIMSHYARFIQNRPYPLPMPEKSNFDPRFTPAEPYVPNTSRPEAVLIDLDGTIALKCSHRGYHDYDARVQDDFPNGNVIAIVKSVIASGRYPIFVSGRKGNAECREATKQWITRHMQLHQFSLFMRAPHDNRPDWLIKTEIFDEHIRDHWNVVAAFDDRNQVVARYREMGITVLQVADGDF